MPAKTKAYQFSDLNNFILRARNQLGLEIRFRTPDPERGHTDQQPENVIRPKPSQVYSKQRYAVADIYQWWAKDKIVDAKKHPVSSKVENFSEPKKVGTFVYVKSSVIAPTGMPIEPVEPVEPGKKNIAIKTTTAVPNMATIKAGNFKIDKNKSEEIITAAEQYKIDKEKYAEDKLKYDTYRYKIYHPDFPHESTSDQFFDEVQWESYYRLGQFIGAEVLGLQHPDDFVAAPGTPEEGQDKKAPQLTVEELIDWFDQPQSCPLPIHSSEKSRSARPAQDDSILESYKGESKEELDTDVQYRI